MKDYRERIKIYRITFRICIPILLILYILVILSEIGVLPFFGPLVFDKGWKEDFWFSFVRSITFGTAVMMIFADRRYSKALKDERLLKKFRIQENDERENMIMIYARSAGCQVSLIFGIVGTIVAGYFSMTVSITLFAFMMLQTLIGCIFQSYYRRKF